LIVPLVALAHGRPVAYRPLNVSAPTFTPYSLNILGKMGLGALSGFEYVAIMAGETRSASRHITRSVLVAAPIIALMFILGTSSVLAFVRPGEVDLISPIAQVLTRGFGTFGVVANFVSIIIIALIGRQVALMSIYLTANARLPMVAGWDDLLPAWFTRLHAKYKTPVNSILLVGALALGFGLFGIVGVDMQEANQLLDNAATIFYATAYVVLFAIPLFAASRVGLRAPLWLRVASLSGLVVSLLGIALTIVPIVEVVSVRAFALKLIIITIVFNLAGALLYRWGRRRKSA
jgi:amino acid transporter